MINKRDTTEKKLIGVETCLQAGREVSEASQSGEAAILSCRKAHRNR